MFTLALMCMQYLCVSIIHRTMRLTTGYLTCPRDLLMHAYQFTCVWLCLFCKTYSWLFRGGGGSLGLLSWNPRSNTVFLFLFLFLLFLFFLLLLSFFLFFFLFLFFLMLLLLVVLLLFEFCELVQTSDSLTYQRSIMFSIVSHLVSLFLPDCKFLHALRVFLLQVAAPEIAMIKIAAPNMALRVIDRAIQVHVYACVSALLTRMKNVSLLMISVRLTS